jgi:CheY-like chemotaxis protein
VGNLLANAAKYTDHEGAITLCCALEGPFVVVKVKDNGIGIAPEMLPHVFDLFTQAPGTLDRSQGGLGIGLTLVKKLVAMHGGSVAVASEGLGRGSEFTIKLPTLGKDSKQKPENIEGESTATEPSAETLSARILVVDDNKDAVHSLAMLLRSSGHDVRTATDGLSALSIAREFRPKFVFLDIGMPDMSGYELLSTLREEESTSKATFIAISGFGRPQDRKRSRDAGFDHHLLKPVDLETLLSILSNSTGT